ncbi:MAG: hypothetical protein E3J72_13765 [Planctomycetota bacterium]|nr:MAG: hypothetical protein E3J72_13765 [Planctomycetota bacterium]
MIYRIAGGWRFFVIIVLVSAFAGLGYRGASAKPKKRKYREGQKSEIKKIMKEMVKYLNTDDEEKRAKLITKMKRLGRAKAFSTFEKAAQASLNMRKPFKKGYSEVETENATDISIYVPSGYSPAKPRPLVVALHHSATGEPWKEMVTLYLRSNLESKKYLAVLPQNPGFGWTAPKSARKVIDAIEYMIENFNVDINRIFLFGYQFGANGCWYMACYHGSRFAGVASLGGALNDERLLNAANVPILAYAASDDASTTPDELEKLAKKLTDAGGNITVKTVTAGPESAAIKGALYSQVKYCFQFFEKQRRNPLPRKFRWELPLRGDDFGYYLAFGEQWEGTVEVEVASESRIDIKTTEEIEGFTLLLSDSLFNLEEPIEVFVNGERKFFDKKPGDIVFLLDCREGWGRSRCFANKIDFTELKPEKPKKETKRRKRKRADEDEDEDKDEDKGREKDEEEKP